MGATGVGRVIEEIPPHEIVGQRFELREAIRNAAKQNGVDPLRHRSLLLSSVIDVFGKDPIMGTLFRSALAKARGEPIKFYMDGGELRALRIGDPELYSLMTELPPALRDAALNWLAISSTAIRAGIVHNPPWMLFQLCPGSGRGLDPASRLCPVQSERHSSARYETMAGYIFTACRAE